VIDEDREVEGLGEQELLDLYRSLVLLRTYDERSLVYHRQGRIGTYAIFWNHEAVQSSAVSRPRGRGLDLSTGRSACCAGSGRARSSRGREAIPPVGGTPADYRSRLRGRARRRLGARLA
jgi:hypothetical protein